MDYYERLRVSRRASRAQIRAAYLRLIAVHHPDRSAAPDAATVTSELNEAYSVLEDAEKRRAYDETLRAAEAPRPAAGRNENAPPGRNAIPLIRCESCGAIDSSLRSAAFFRCVSFIASHSWKAESGVLCGRCRNRAAIKANLITATAGWWSPKGLYYTPRALWLNAAGGAQDASRNAELLRVLGHQLFARDEVAESADALRASLALVADERTSKFLEHVSAGAPRRSAPRRTRSVAPFLAAVAPLFFCSSAVLIGIRPAAQALSGSSRATQPPVATAAMTTAAPAHGESSLAGGADPEVARLAAIVEVRSPFVGTHSEGQSVVRDHVLDRARFDAAEIDQIAEAIHRQMAPGEPRTVAAYFNARVLALSIRVINALRVGDPVADHASAVERLMESEPVSAWLGSSAYARAATDLRKELKALVATYTGGRPLSALEQELSLRKRELSEERAKLDFLRDKSVYQYNALVGGHNRRIRSAAALLRRYRRRASEVARLELAFNRCLDPKILFTRPEGVDITRTTSGFEESSESGSP